MLRKEHSNRKWNRIWLFYLLGVLMVGLGFGESAYLAQAAPPGQSAQEGQQIFQQNCVACHTIGNGRLVGPDLKDVTVRREKAWLLKFVSDPNKMIASQDPTALTLLKENNNVIMPTFGLSQAQIESVLAYVASAGSGQPAAGQPAAQAALPPGDPVRGHSLFVGRLSQGNAGPACISCHTVQGAAQLGGGTLGPDLTHVLVRYGGNAGLASSLAALPFPTMQGVFLPAGLTPQDQADLLAYFIWADQLPAPQVVQPLTWIFFGIGVAGALLLFVLMLINWPRQRRSLSDQLRSRPVV